MPAESQESTPMMGEPLDTPASSTSRVRDAIHPVQFGIFPTRFLLPHPDDEILSGFEEDVSSIRDGYTSLGGGGTSHYLGAPLVNLNSANPACREAQDRKRSPTNERNTALTPMCPIVDRTEEAQHLQLEPRTPTRQSRSHRKARCGEMAHHHAAGSN